MRNTISVDIPGCHHNEPSRDELRKESERLSNIEESIADLKARVNLIVDALRIISERTVQK